VGCRVGVGREAGRERLGGRDADSVLAAAISPRGAADVRDQRDALHPAQEGRGLAGPRAEDGERPGIADGTPRRPRRRRAAADRRADPVCRHARRVCRARSRRSLQRWRAGVRRDRRRPQVPHDQQPVAGRHRQSRLRTGGSRPRGREPHRVRDLLRGEAAVLHRGREHLQQLRARRGEQLLGLQPRRAAAVLLTANRPGAAGQCQR